MNSNSQSPHRYFVLIATNVVRRNFRLRFRKEWFVAELVVGKGVFLADRTTQLEEKEKRCNSLDLISLTSKCLLNLPD